MRSNDPKWGMYIFNLFRYRETCLIFGGLNAHSSFKHLVSNCPAQLQDGFTGPLQVITFLASLYPWLIGGPQPEKPPPPPCIPSSYSTSAPLPFTILNFFFLPSLLTVIILSTHLKTKGWVRIPTGVINVKCSCKWHCFPTASSTCCLSWLPS